MDIMDKLRKLFSGASTINKVTSIDDMQDNGGILLFTEDLIDRYPAEAMEVLGYAGKLGIGLGWHYLLDLTWILSKLPSKPGRILDAGAGTGLLQYILAAKGHSVISVDAFIRNPSNIVTKLYTIKKSGSSEAIKTAYASYHGQDKKAEPEQLPSRNKAGFGEIEFHCGDLSNLCYIETNEADMVVSVSALEHNAPQNLPPILSELRRAAKPGAPMLITISVDGKPRFDEPSYSWLLDEKGIAEHYQLSDGYQTNFADHDNIKNLLKKKGNRLERWLAGFYYQSGKNGMPWGQWNPAYLPAGVSIMNRK